jgi:hypothetical protein
MGCWQRPHQQAWPPSQRLKRSRFRSSCYCWGCFGFRKCRLSWRVCCNGRSGHVHQNTNFGSRGFTANWCLWVRWGFGICAGTAITDPTPRSWERPLAHPPPAPCAGGERTQGAAGGISFKLHIWQPTQGLIPLLFEPALFVAPVNFDVGDLRDCAFLGTCSTCLDYFMLLCGPPLHPPLPRPGPPAPFPAPGAEILIFMSLSPQK